MSELHFLRTRTTDQAYAFAEQLLLSAFPDNFYSSGTWGNADNYDLCINSSVLGINKTAEIIRDFVVQKLHIELPQETISPTPEVF